MLLIQPKVFESRWTLLLVSLVMVGMLAVFHAVVSAATQVGELRRQATAAQAAAVVRCNALPSWNVSKDCLKGLDIQVTADASTVPAVQ